MKESRETEAPSCPATDSYPTQIDFTAFILSLAQSVLIDLGMSPHPETGQREANLRQACNTIDILAMLQEKTRGNLTREEENLLTGSLYQLRLSFVEVKHRQEK